MEPKTIATIIGSALLGGVFGATIQPADTSKPLLLKENTELHIRLQEPVLWDISIVSDQELLDSHLVVAAKYGISKETILKSTASVQDLIKVELMKQDKLCKI